MEATQQEVNRFVREVDLFMENYDKLMDPQFRSDVYASRDSGLIADYEQASQQAKVLKNTIEATTGAWSAAKKAYSSVTDQTSMAIGDAIDEIRSWFGYDPAPGLNGLGALQLPAAAWIAGIISAAFLLNRGMDKIFISVEASRLQRMNPGISREQALIKAADVITGGGLSITTFALLAAAGLTLYTIMRRR